LAALSRSNSQWLKPNSETRDERTRSDPNKGVMIDHIGGTHSSPTAQNSAGGQLGSEVDYVVHLPDSKAKT
jgi:hypothetical protein